MKQRITVLALLLALALLPALAGDSGRAIMEKSEDLPEPNTLENTSVMEIHKAGEVTRRELRIRGVREGENEKILLEITDPYSMKVLTHTKEDGDDLQWVKLRNGKVKQIASSDRKNAFENSHFFYEDLRSRNINDYTYELLGEATVNDTLTWRIEALPKPEKSIYDKAIFYVIKEGNFQYFVLMVDIYYKGYLYKRLMNFDIKKTEGIITPYKAVMYRKDSTGETLGHTILEIESLEYNENVPSSIFRSSGL